MRQEEVDSIAQDVAHELHCVKNCRIEIRISTRVIKTLKRPRRAKARALVSKHRPTDYIKAFEEIGGL